MGNGGMISVAHGALMGVGAYTVALLITHVNAPVVLAFIAAPLAAGLAGLFIGYFSVRLFGVLFAMLTLAFGMVLFAIAHQWYDFTRGDDGIVGLPALVSPIDNYYILVVIIVVGCIAVMWRLVNSPFGRSVRAIRQNPNRPSFLGVNVYRQRLVMFTISGFFSGLAGALFCLIDGQVFPHMLHWATSIEILIIVALGGVGSFFGPVLGAFLMVMIRFWVGTFTIYWMIFLGLILFALVLFRPEGLMSFFEEKVRQFRLRPIKVRSK
jgi:branched-chain amino acid transport system permease protein